MVDLNGLLSDVRLLVIGDPVAHSLSPAMHNAALRHLGMPFQYGSLRVAPEDLVAAFELLRSRELIGWNLTLPHKLESVRLMHCLDEIAENLGAVNTVVHRSGKLFGFNTDAKGLEIAVEEAFNRPLGSMRVAILGAGGGAGQTAARYLASIRVPLLYLVNRTVEKVEKLAKDLSSGSSSQIIWTGWDRLPEVFAGVDLIINATTIGLDGKGADIKGIEARHLFFDMVYAPGETESVRFARSQGANAVDGLAMLLYQGVLAFEIWFGKPAPIEPMRNALYRAAGRKVPESKASRRQTFRKPESSSQ
ncbi:MAG: shikimate dehydrogenase [Verrucomicrobia bacterium]|nr:shikimate dehydrogenase [Verrucomicrobiota bacterium]